MSEESDVVQLSLGIDASDVSEKTALVSVRREIARRPNRKQLDMDPILSMRDVVFITGKHRTTILRWIKQGLFPKRSAPKSRPIGWRRSEIEHWAHAPGSSDPSCAKATSPVRTKDEAV